MKKTKSILLNLLLILLQQLVSHLDTFRYFISATFTFQFSLYV